MLDALKNIDREIFLIINGAHNNLLDFVMWWASDKLIWIPFYAWLLYILIREYGKQAGWILLTVALMILCSDQLTDFIKNTVQRPRPSHEISLIGIIHLVNNYNGGPFGFVSSHAANSMAITTLLFFILPQRLRLPRMVLIPFVILIGYSRIYLGVHYPLDVIGGWMVGLLTAWLSAKILLLKITIPEK